jgi:hypothetical protein
MQRDIMMIESQNVRADTHDENWSSEVSIRVTIRDYLDMLEGLEAQNPPHKRRPIPTITDLADAVNTSRVALSNIANSNVKLLNLRILAAVLSELRRRGFKTKLSDLLTAYPLEDAETGGE